MEYDVRKIYTNDSLGWYDYQPMLDAFGKIAIQVDDIECQGDSRLLYDENGKIGYLIFGWGSCSGCDALQACDTFDELQKLCDALQGDIKWFDSKKEALEWFKTHDWEGDYSWYDEETKEFVQKCIAYLSEEGKQTNFDVTVDREKFIGGSDLPAILGISPFKTRWELLLEKAGLAESDFDGNRFTAYGNELEPKIRDFVNQKYNTEFVPDRKYVDDCRFHCDGNNGEAILEIKTTSHIEDDVHGYKAYLAQLLAYTEAWGYSKAILAVYHRPEDFSTEFDEDRLHLYEIDMKGYEIFLERLHTELDKFRSDLKMLKENPLMTEEDFLPTAVVEAANKVALLECRMAEYKTIEAEYKRVKQSLYEAMEKHGIKTWETFNGTKITKVDGIPEGVKAVNEFDEKAFAESHPRLYKQFSKVVQKKTAAKSGYVKITLPKG